MVTIEEIGSTNDLSKLFFDKFNGPLIITPGPKEADNIRASSAREFFERKVDPVTISNFTNQMIDLLCKSDSFPNNFSKKVLRKSDIFLNLAGIWEEAFGFDQNELFFQAYQVLSELRGTSLDINLVNNALDELDSNLQKAVKVLWIYLDEQGLMDEHRAYKILSEKADALELNADGVIVIGFSHLSAIQVDMLNEMGKFHEVIVAIPAGLKGALTRFDWPVWLDNYDESKLVEISKQNNLETFRFTQNKLSEELEKRNFHNLIFLKEEIKPVDFFEIPKNKTSYRFEENLFDIEVDSLYQKLCRESLSSVENLKEYLHQLALDLLMSQSSKPDNFIRLKVVQLYLESLESLMEDFIGDRLKVTNFKLYLLKNVCHLNSPRSSLVTYSSNKTKDTILSINDTKFKSINDLCLIIKKEDLPFSTGMENLNVEISSFLATIGPIKTPALNNKMNLAWLKIALLEVKNKVVLIEDGAEELGSEIISELNIEEVLPIEEVSLFSSNEVGEIDYYGDVKPFSATKLQAFVDCPKKFEELYLLKNRNFPVLNNDLIPSQLGLIEHEVIQFFHERFEETGKFISVEDLSKELLSKYLINFKINLSEIKFKKHLNEIIIHSRNGIRFLSELKSSLNNATFHFEKDLGRIDNINGRVDVVVEFDNNLMVLDFKRSAGGTSSITEMLKFESIQLPFYSNNIEKVFIDHDCVGIGYVVLNNLDESIYFGTKEGIPFGKEKIISFDNWEVFKNDFALELKALKQNINECFVQKNFNPMPKSSSTCDFCSAKLFCRYGSEV